MQNIQNYFKRFFHGQKHFYHNSVLFGGNEEVTKTTELGFPETHRQKMKRKQTNHRQINQNKMCAKKKGRVINLIFTFHLLFQIVSSTTF